MLDRIKDLLWPRPKQPADSPIKNSQPKPVPRSTRNFPEFFDHIKSLGFDANTVIDVGVAKGTPPLYEAFPNAYFILIEPVEEFIPDLEAVLSQYSGEYHNCALMATPGESSIMKTPHLFGSSMMHRASGENKNLQKVTVETLDNLVGNRKLDGAVLLKTDCQGGDFEVVKGAIKTLQQCDVVIMEVSLFKFWGNHHPAPLDILNFMAAQGFSIYDFLDGLFRPLDNALGQLDIVFVRDDGIFRKDQVWVQQ